MNDFFNYSSEDFNKFSVGRLKEFDYLSNWIYNIDNSEQSLLLHSPENSGKTHIIKEFYFNLFDKDKKIFPFYYSIDEGKKHIKDFCYTYLCTFLSQYLAKYLNNKEFLINTLELHRIKELAKNYLIPNIFKIIDDFENIEKKNSVDLLWKYTISIPSNLAYLSEIKIVQIIDNIELFNNFYIDKAKKSRYKNFISTYIPLLNSASSPIIFLLNSGFNSINIKEILNNRIRFYYLNPINLESAKEFVKLNFDKLNIKHDVEIQNIIANYFKNNLLLIKNFIFSYLSNNEDLSIEKINTLIDYSFNNKFGQTRIYLENKLHLIFRKFRFDKVKELVLFFLYNSDKSYSSLELLKEFSAIFKQHRATYLDLKQNNSDFAVDNINEYYVYKKINLKSFDRVLEILFELNILDKSNKLNKYFINKNSIFYKYLEQYYLNDAKILFNK